MPHGLKDATTDSNAIWTWWQRYPDANIGTPTSWAIVLDVDPCKGGDQTLAELERRHGALPATPEVLTGGGGRHIYFARPPVEIRNSTEKVGPGLDIRGEGGYVLLPPSAHVSGRVYVDELLHPLFDTPLAPMPVWLVALANAAAASNGHASGEATDWTALLAGAPLGQRHAVAARIAGHLLGKRLAPGEVEAILLGYAARCTPPFDQDDVRRIARDLAAKDAAKAAAEGQVHEEPATDDGPIPVLVRLADVEPEAVDWAWPGRVPRGKLTLIIGEPGEGKTHVTQDMAARTTRGAAWPDGGQAPAGAVIVLTSEDEVADTLRPRIDRLGGDPAHVYVLRGVRVEGTECPFNLEHDLPALEQAIGATGAVLVVIDPVSAYLGKKDSYKDAQIRGILSPLAALAERYRAAVVAILHLTKAAQRKLLLRAQGSVAFVAQARVVLAVGEDPDQPGRRLLVGVKNNLGPIAGALAFTITDAGLRWEPTPVDGNAEKLLAVDEVPSRTERRERDTAATFLRDLLWAGPVASKQVEADARANGISQRTLWRAKAELGVIAERTQTADWQPWSVVLAASGENMTHSATSASPGRHPALLTLADWLARAYCECWQTWQTGGKYPRSLVLSHPAIGMLAIRYPSLPSLPPCHVCAPARATLFPALRDTDGNTVSPTASIPAHRAHVGELKRAGVCRRFQQLPEPFVTDLGACDGCARARVRGR